MALRVRLRDAGADPVAFGCSPAHEALRSVHVLHDVRRHPLHISWVLRTRSRMPAELKDEADRFAYWYRDRPLVLWEVWPQAGAGSWADELAAVRAAPVERFAEHLIHGALLRRGRGRRLRLDAFRR